MGRMAHAVVEGAVEAAGVRVDPVDTRLLSFFHFAACSCPIVFVHTQGHRQLSGSLQLELR